MIRFCDINRRNSVDHKPNYQRHHLIPRQAGAESDFQNILETLAKDRFGLEDFERNGILLPSCEKEALRTGRPLHRGPHPLYNEIVMKRLFQISKLGNRFDDLIRRQNFLRFRLSLLQSSLRMGLRRGHFSKIYLSSRDPLRSGVRFDRMDSRIDMINHTTRPLKLEHIRVRLSSKLFRENYISEL